MKPMKIITVVLMILLSIGIASAGIKSSEITWSESPLYPLGDYIVTTTYDDGYAEGVYHRGSLSPGYISYLTPKVTISTTTSTISIPITLEGQSCALSGVYSLHHVDLYKDSAASNILYGQDVGMITCGQTKSYIINVPKSNLGSIATTPGSYQMVIKETMWNTAGMIVTETRQFTLVVEGVAPTPTPTPTPNTGTISITSNPSGATVRVSSTEKGYTPVTFPMPPGNYIVSTSLAGYQTDNYGMTVVNGQVSSHNVNLQPVSTTPTPTQTTPQPTYTTPTPTQTTPQPTYTTPNPTQTTPAPTSTVPADCPSGYVWDSTYETCRPITDVITSSGTIYIIIGVVLLAGLYLLKRKDLKW